MTLHLRWGPIKRAIFRGRRSIWWGWVVTPVAPRTVHDVPYYLRHTSYCDFSWQAQHLVMLECHFSWQAQYLVKFPKGSNLALLLLKVISESAFGIKSAFDVKSAFRYHFCYRKALLASKALLIAKVISGVLYRRMRHHHFLTHDTICIKIFNYILFMFVTHTARVSTNENFCFGVDCEVLY